MYNDEQGGQLRIKNEMFKPVSNIALDYLQKNIDIQSTSIFDEPILYLVLRIVGDSHQFISKLYGRVKKFVESVHSMSILLVDINANFVKKRSCLEQMILVVDPTFNFKRHEEQLIFVLKQFEMRKEKQKTFLSWANKFYLKVDSQ